MRLVCALVRAWAAIYTCGVPEAERTARRLEIESDLWESCHDGAADRSASRMLVRLVLGIPDDLGWRVEQPGSTRAPLLVVGVAATALVAAVWIVSRGLGVEAPAPPAAKTWHARYERKWVQLPPPPPPPPPPCPPSSMRTSLSAPCSPFP